MDLALSKILEFSPLNQCHVVAGLKGIERTVTSINIMDSPDPGPWVNQGQLVLSTGYVFKDDPSEQVRLLRYLAKQECAGLAIKFKRFLSEPPSQMVGEADKLKFPLIDIPYHLSLAELVSSLMKGILENQYHQNKRNKIEAFFTSLFNGELKGRDEILAEGRLIGLLPNCKYIVLSTSFTETLNDSKLEKLKAALKNIFTEVSTIAGANVITAELGDVMAVLQVSRLRKEPELKSIGLTLAKLAFESLKQKFPWGDLTIGLSMPKSDVLEIEKAYCEAQKAVYIGRQTSNTSTQAVYEYAELKPYALLGALPPEDCYQYAESYLGVLTRFDKENNSELIKTLEVFFACNGRSSECAQKLFVHRNTVNFRIARIQELLGMNLDDGETVFSLQLALKIAKLKSQFPHLFKISDS